MCCIIGTHFNQLYPYKLICLLDARVNEGLLISGTYEKIYFVKEDELDLWLFLRGGTRWIASVSIPNDAIVVIELDHRLRETYRSDRVFVHNIQSAHSTAKL